MNGRKRAQCGRDSDGVVDVEECVARLDEPFRRSGVVGWFRRHYPDVKETTLAAHIYAATANATNRAENHPYLSRRDPLLRRIDQGLYVRATRADASTLSHRRTVGGASGRYGDDCPVPMKSARSGAELR